MLQSLNNLTKAALILALTIVIQLIGLPQLLTGPMVNCFILLAGYLINPLAGIIIGLFTPLVALLRGTLPAPLMLAIPFIMLGNGLFVYLGTRFTKNLPAKVCSLILAAVAKFLVLTGAVTFIITVPAKIGNALMFPQLITALIGGALALLLEKLLKDIL
jgi:hypothetical protein